MVDEWVNTTTAIAGRNLLLLLELVDISFFLFFPSIIVM